MPGKQGGVCCSSLVTRFQQRVHSLAARTFPHAAGHGVEFGGPGCHPTIGRRPRCERENAKMAVRFTIAITDGASAPLREFAARVEDTEPLMRAIGTLVEESVEENFEVGGRPRWKPLAASTVKAKGHSKPLFASGILRNAVMKATKDQAIIGVQPASKAYAAIHQFGGKAGRNHSVTIPARRYMLLQDDDLAEIEELVRTWPEKAMEKK